MAYTYEKTDTGLIKEGDYEVEIERIERRTLPSGKEKIMLQYRIRTDVEQDSKNRVLFEDIWAEREHPDYFNRKRINQLLGTQKIEDGHVFEDINSVMKFLEGQRLIVHVVVQMDDYKGEDVNSIAYYKTSKSLPSSLPKADPPKPAESVPGPTPKTDDDDDLPF